MICCCYQDGSTPLHWAAREGHENILNLLLQRGADRYLTDQYGRTPLHEAALFGRGEIVKILLKRGDDTNITDKDQQALFDVRRNPDAVPHDHDKLLEGRSHKEDTTEDSLSSLTATTKSIRFETVQRYTVAGLLGEIQDERSKSSTGDVSLLGGIRNLHLSAIRYYDQGISSPINDEVYVNLQDKKGRSCLHLAAGNGYTKVVKCLIDKGADVNLQDNEGRSCLHLAVENGFTQVMTCLIDKGADVNVQDQEGRSSIYLALHNRHGDIATKLFVAGAELPEEADFLPSDDKTKMQLIIQKRAAGLAKEHDSLCVIYTSCTVNGDGTKKVPYFVFICNDKEKKAGFPRELGVNSIGKYAVLVREGSATILANNGGQSDAHDSNQLPVGCGVCLGDRNDVGSLGVFMYMDKSRFDFQRIESTRNAFLTCYHVIGTYADHINHGGLVRPAINKPVFAKTQSAQWNCGTVCDTSLGNVKLDNDLLKYGVEAAAIVLNTQATENLTLTTGKNEELSFDEMGYLDVHSLKKDDIVYKVGCVTGFTSGKYVNDTTFCKLTDGTGHKMDFYNMILVSSNSDIDFSKEGDSGAAVYKMENGFPHIIGLIVGLSKELDGNNKRFTIVSRIVPILRSLSTSLQFRKDDAREEVAREEDAREEEAMETDD
ncbi:ankyrin-3 [Lingula anatina]|uniref:Ankyrin-3 n=1 Tax=Lingula anatina TaxID=7574 RepID=A0A1S3KHE5_LINAN|nr:ankyrin-3 [Lingula anatina]|eukprot:XP_013421641.1 ankyrin-3 [Lingula anatina]